VRRGLVVREVSPEEFDAVAALTVAAYEVLFGDEGLGDYRDELADVATRASAGTVLVSTRQEKVIGAVTYVSGPGTPISEFDDPDACGIRMLAVAPDHQGHGAGRALVEACVALGRADGRRRVTLHSTRQMITARAMYERMGFVRTEALDVVVEEVVDDGGPFRLLAYQLEL
jgi:ribosomal protein S18 acetylase RimI-like enzyme